jgi:hypothetical protein
MFYKHEAMSSGPSTTHTETRAQMQSKETVKKAKIFAIAADFSESIKQIGW